MNRATMAAAAAAILCGSALAAPRPKAVGLVDYLSRYQYPRGKRGAKAGLKNMEARLKEIGLRPERVSPDIFLPRNKAACDRFQRIVVPGGAEFFSRAIHEGMNDYVRRGGLLVTNVSMVLEDVDEDYVVTNKDKQTDYPAKSFLGVRGHQSARITRLKALAECPLTRGMKEGEWITLTKPTAGRNARNLSADVVILSDRIMKRRKPSEQPFLTFKHQENGACIYLVGRVGTLKGPTALRVFRNIFSAETLNWLCLQE